MGDSRGLPERPTGTTPGPWSDPADFTHTIKEPTNPVSSAGPNRLVMSWDAKTGTKQYRVQISKRGGLQPAHRAEDDRQPRLRAPRSLPRSYTSGGTFYWRVAAIDGDGNLGTYREHAGDVHAAPDVHGRRGHHKHFKVTFTGKLVKNRARDISVKVRDAATLNVISGAQVRAYGAGVPLTIKNTNSSGVAKFRLKPTQLGKVTFRVSKTGYATVYIQRRVYRP